MKYLCIVSCFFGFISFAKANNEKLQQAERNFLRDGSRENQKTLLLEANSLGVILPPYYWKKTQLEDRELGKVVFSQLDLHLSKVEDQLPNPGELAQLIFWGIRKVFIPGAFETKALLIEAPFSMAFFREVISEGNPRLFFEKWGVNMVMLKPHFYTRDLDSGRELAWTYIFHIPKGSSEVHVAYAQVAFNLGKTLPLSILQMGTADHYDLMADRLGRAEVRIQHEERIESFFRYLKNKTQPRTKSQWTLDSEVAEGLFNLFADNPSVSVDEKLRKFPDKHFIALITLYPLLYDAAAVAERQNYVRAALSWRKAIRKKFSALGIVLSKKQLDDDFDRYLTSELKSCAIELRLGS